MTRHLTLAEQRAVRVITDENERLKAQIDRLLAEIEMYEQATSAALAEVEDV